MAHTRTNVIEIRTPLLDKGLSESELFEKWAIDDIIKEVQSYMESYIETADNINVYVYKDALIDRPQVTFPKCRKRRPFIECVLIMEHKEEIMHALHSVLDGKGGKNLGYIVRVVVDMGIIERPTFSQLKQEFKITFSRSAYDKYFNGIKNMPDTLRRTITAIFSKYIHEN